MAAIDDLIARIEDKALRERLQAEAQRLTRQKRFGLVFEEHLPELTPIYSARVRKGNLVALRGKALTEVWYVLSVTKNKAHCLNRANGEQREVPVEELVVVRQFGEPIFPALIPMDKVQNGPAGAPWHTLIEADNYHALQLLEYLYAGQVDCIYIDPPYNTGARDWKYNNDYVDVNDHWRHSKWLAMMRRRLVLAKRLLNPQTGVLIVTIDEHEVHHLGMLLEQIYPESFRQMVTIVITPGGITQGRFARVEEYALYCFSEKASTALYHDDLLSLQDNQNNVLAQSLWQSLIRRGVGAQREDRPGMFFPIKIDPHNQRIIEIGEPLPLGKEPDLNKAPTQSVAWPIRSDGSLGRWRIGPASCKSLLEAGYLKLGGYDEKRKTWTVLYLQKKTVAEIAGGTIAIVGRDSITGAVELSFESDSSQLRPIKTVWNRSIHHAGSHGSTLLRTIFGKGGTKFSFPKSVYSVRDAVAAVVRDKPNALILDFFAGSGTTLNAVNVLNAADGGQRRCILVTNNEVSDEEAKALAAQGYHPSDDEWEAQGICRSVTWPRSKYTIQGQRDDGTELEGEYFTGKTVTKEKPRRFKHIGFVGAEQLNAAARKKQLVALIKDFPQTLVTDDSAFIVSADHPASMLFDEAQAEAWLEALEEQDHLTDFYIVAARKATFDAIRTSVIELLGPLTETEAEKRPMREGFAANLEYFRLDFLEKDAVALGRQFREILPLLWLRAGAVGPRPELPKNKPLPAMLLPERNPLAVLVDETRFADFQVALAKRPDLTHVFLVTDSEEAFQEMAAQVSAPHVIQLYRDYLENFVINQGDGA